jgi:Xaa-Pro aminopeptidase
MPHQASEDQPLAASSDPFAPPAAMRTSVGGGPSLSRTDEAPVKTRSAGLADVIADQDLLGLVASSYEGLCYFGDADIRSQLMIPERLAFVIVPAASSPILLVCNIDESQVRTQTGVADIRSYVEFEEDPTVVLAGLLADLGMTEGRLGIEAARLPVGAARKLIRAFPTLELVGVDRELAGLQARKSGAEVERLGALARDLLFSLDVTLAVLDREATEIDCSRELMRRVALIGGTPMFVQFAAGDRALVGHPDAEPAPLSEGTLWRTDFGTRLPGGLCGDVARTGVVGSASSVQAELFSIVHAAQQAAIALAEPGRPACDLFHACREEFRRHRMPFFAPHVGHGIGFGLHEAPLLEPHNQDPLAVGAVLMIEPFVLLVDRHEAYHTEDMVVVTTDGPLQLTTPQETLLPLT